MFFLSESAHQQLADVVAKFAEVEGGPLQAAPYLLAIDPDHGMAFQVLAKAAIVAGDSAEALRLAWKALQLRPLDPVAYTLLSSAYATDPQFEGVGQHLTLTSCLCVSLCREVPEGFAKIFGSFIGSLGDDWNFDDPETYYELYQTSEKLPAMPPEVEERVRPFRLLLEFAHGVLTSLDPSTLERVRDEAAAGVPIWRAALRAGLSYPGVEDPEIFGYLIALLGEFGGPELLPDLWEIFSQDQKLLLYSSWALCRMAKRYPAEMIAVIQANMASADAGLRAGMAEHLALMGNSEDVEKCLLALVADFKDMASDENAAYLLMAVFHALVEGGHVARANELLARYERSLSKEDRQWLREKLEDGFVPEIVGPALNVIDIAEICIEHVMAEDDEEDEDDDHWDDDDEFEDEEEEEAAFVKPGRNDPCWCGSGKKYKKCHLDADNQPPEEEEDLDETVEDAMEGLLSTADHLFTKRQMRAAGRQYFGDSIDSEQRMQAGSVQFLYWYLLDYRPESSGRTAIEEHIQRHGQKLKPEVLSLLESWRDARYGFFEVTAVKTGESLQFTDLFTGDVVQLPDLRARPEDIEGVVLARIAKHGDEFSFLHDAISVPRRVVPALKEFIENGAESAGQTPAEFVRAQTHRLHRIVEEE
jgi:hypothetical protein